MEKVKHIIHVNRQFIAKNAKDGCRRPIYTIKSVGTKNPRYASEVAILGPSRLVEPGKQLSCGARAWIETDSDLELTNETTFQAVKEKFG
jgi:hypothetical protein